MPVDACAPPANVRPFSHPIRVYWEDTDAGGVVYHASYLRFLERARTEGLRSLGVSQQALRKDEDRIFVVHAMQIDFRAPARLDDLLEVHSRIADLGHASLVFSQRIMRPADTRVLVEAQVRVACLSASSFRPRGLPEPLRLRFAQFLHSLANET